MKLSDALVTLASQAGNLDKRLDDASLPKGALPAIGLSLATDIKGTLGDTQWKALASLAGTAAVHVIGAVADKDPDAIVGVPARTGDRLTPAAVLAPIEGRAWLKFLLRGATYGKLSRRRSGTSIALSGAAHVDLGAYCQVDAGKTLRAALAERGGDVPFILDALDVRDLRVGDACFTALGGTLSARLQLRWADVLSGPIDVLQDCLPADRPLIFALDTEASLSVDLSIEDSFRLVWSGRDAHWLDVSLHRAANQAFALKGEASVVARLADPDIARQLFADLLAQMVGASPAQVEQLRAQLRQVLALLDASAEDLAAMLQAATGQPARAFASLGLDVVDRRLQQLQILVSLLSFSDAALAQKLAIPLDRASKLREAITGWADTLTLRIGTVVAALLSALNAAVRALPPLAALIALLERLDRFEAALVRVASQRIELGLAFEYKRIATDALVFSASMQRQHADFAHWHRALLGLDLAPVLAASQQAASGITLQRFLHQRTLKRSFTLGLDLGTFYADKDRVTREWIDSERLLPGATDGAPWRSERRHVFSATRSRSETLLGNTSVWRGDFDADFRSTGEWHFTLALLFKSATTQCNASWLGGAADYAALWGVTGEHDVEVFRQRLIDTGALGQPVTLELGYTLQPSAFAAPGFIDSFDRVSDSCIVDALATALQRIDALPERCDIALRRQVYASAVRVLLGTSGVDLRNTRAVGQFVARQLRPASAAVRAFESRIDPPNPGAIVDLGARAGSLLGALREFRQAGQLARLLGNERTGSTAEKQQIEKALAGWDLAWRDRYLLRWQVSLLRALASQCALPAPASSARMKLTVTHAGKSTAHLFAPRR